MVRRTSKKQRGSGRSSSSKKQMGNNSTWSKKNIRDRAALWNNKAKNNRAFNSKQMAKNKMMYNSNLYTNPEGNVAARNWRRKSNGKKWTNSGGGCGCGKSIPKQAGGAGKKRKNVRKNKSKRRNSRR